MDDSETPHAQRPRVLVVDDSKVMRLAANRALRDEFEVLQAGDGESGWHSVVAAPGLELMFCDLAMPGLDGFGLLRRIRGSGDPRIRELPVVIITGDEDDSGARERALALGATDFIAKPFDPIDLTARARAHARSVQAARALQQRTADLEAQATVDPLTGLGNRRHFIERLGQDRSFALRHRQDLAVLCLDVDGFQEMSAGRGPAAAKAGLRQVADMLRGHIRREDGAFRVDEARFALILPAANPVGARHLAERLRRDTSGLSGDFGCVTLSVAVLAAGDELGAEDLLTEAARRLAVPGGDRVLTEPAAPAQSDAPAPRLESIDHALQLLVVGRTNAISAQLQGLLEKLAPLLRLADRSQRAWLRKLLDDEDAGPLD